MARKRSWVGNGRVDAGGGLETVALIPEELLSRERKGAGVFLNP